MTSDEVFDYFDALEWHEEVHASEAALTVNPGGTLFYAIYNAVADEDPAEDLEGWSDAIVRRTMELGDGGMKLSSQGRTETGGENPPGGGGDDDHGPDDDHESQGGRDD
jgi:hypothetical protein